MKNETPNKILLVDDTLSIIDFLKDLLLSKGYQVYIATSGEKAIQIAEHILPDIILLDILMPGIDGYQTCKELKSKPSVKNTPIIFMSALHEPFDKVKAFNAGASDYICKPIETEELFARIQTHLKLYSIQRQLSESNIILEKRVEERTHELLEAKEKAEESDRLKSAFLANISHEIRTPLNGILGFSELISSEDLPDDKRMEYIQTIVECSEKLLKTVSDILDLSKIQAHIHKLHKKPVQVREILEQTVSVFLAQAAQKQLNLNVSDSLEPKDLIIYTDESKLVQILSILIENAIKFTEMGSVIVGYTSTYEFIELYVKDTGVGIAENLINKMFDNFRQAEDDFSRIHGGVGVGLSICKGLVELLGGSIRAESCIGEGTCFFVKLPIEDLPEIKLKDDNELKAPAPKEKFYILIAEDEFANFLYVSELLGSSENVIIVHADNGLKAVELVKEHREIDLVLMDIKMPDLDGVEAMKQIKEFRPSLPVIALTAYASDEDRYRFLHAGFDNYFSKPVRSSDLLAFVNTYLK